MNRLLQRLLGRTQPSHPPIVASPQSAQGIVVVSGLPRSGTSMMMKMLEAGGMPVITDRQRTADSDNPRGYYEFERVKEMDKGDTAWVAGARGSAVKVISALIEYLPPAYGYQVLFMHRNIEEVLASQQKMLHHRGEVTDTISDAEMAELFHKHVNKVLAWIRSQNNFQLLELDYNQLLVDPLPHIRSVNAFLDHSLDESEMAAVVDPGLYRNRA